MRGGCRSRSVLVRSELDGRLEEPSRPVSMTSDGMRRRQGLISNDVIEAKIMRNRHDGDRSWHGVLFDVYPKGGNNDHVTVDSSGRDVGQPPWRLWRRT